MTVFSLDFIESLHKGKGYKLTLGVNQYIFDEDHIADMRFSEAAPNYGMYGLTTGQFSCRAYAENAENVLQNLTPNMQVSFSELSCGLVLTSASVVSKNVLSITASTKTINSSIPFYKDGYVDKGSDGKSLTYKMDEVVGDAFGLFDVPFSCSKSSGMKLYLSEFEGKGCNRIIEEASKLYGGYFCIQPSGSLMLNVYGESSGTVDGTDLDNISEIFTQSVRAITKVVATDSESGDVYTYGGLLAPWYETETLEGDYLFGEAACRSAADFMRHSYKGWSCEDVVVSQTPDLNSLFETSNGNLTIQKIDARYTKNHIIASLGAQSMQMSFADYKNSAERKLEARVKANSVYGGTSIDSKDGLMFVWQEKSESESSRKSERYGFTPGKGGVTEYSGALKSKKYPGIALNADLSGFKMQYDDTSFDFEVVIDGDNVTLKEKEKEGG